MRFKDFFPIIWIAILLPPAFGLLMIWVFFICAQVDRVLPFLGLTK